MDNQPDQIIKLTLKQKHGLRALLLKYLTMHELRTLYYEIPLDLGSLQSAELGKAIHDLMHHCEIRGQLPRLFELSGELFSALNEKLLVFQADLETVSLSEARQTDIRFAFEAFRQQLAALKNRRVDNVPDAIKQALRDSTVRAKVWPFVEDLVTQAEVTIEQLLYRLAELDRLYLNKAEPIIAFAGVADQFGTDVKITFAQAERALEQGNFRQVDDTLNTINRLLLSASEVVEDKETQRFIQWWAAKLMMAEAKRLRSNHKYMESAQMFHAASELLPRSYNDFDEILSLCIYECSMSLYYAGQYAKALPLAQEALTIRQKIFPEVHTEVAASLNNLASLYRSQGEYAAALPLYQKALAIHEQVLGTQHPNTAISLNSLAALYESQGEYTAALPLYQKALAIREQVLGTQHPSTATSLNNLALLYRSQGEYTAALPLYQKALAIREQVLGTQHPSTATSLNNLAELYRTQGEYAAALPLYQKALAITEQVLGTQHPNTATSLNNLALLYYSQDDYAAALPLFQKAVEIAQNRLGSEHPDTKLYLKNLAYCQAAMAKAPTEQDTTPTPNTPPAPPATETPAPQTKPNIFQKFWQKLKP